jgi:hypothetical protein
MNTNQVTINVQASRIRSALMYLPHEQDSELRELWEYGLTQELVDIFQNMIIPQLTHY